MGEFDRKKSLTLFDMAGLEVRLADILGTRVELCATYPTAFAMIENFTAGMDFKSFRGDPKIIAAVERKLLDDRRGGSAAGGTGRVPPILLTSRRLPTPAGQA